MNTITTNTVITNTVTANAVIMNGVTMNTNATNTVTTNTITTNTSKNKSITTLHHYHECHTARNIPFRCMYVVDIIICIVLMLRKSKGAFN